MKVLIACEESATVREAFSKLGHEAWSCDLQETRIPGNHYKGDVFDIINENWDLMIAHPPCTFLTVSAARWIYDYRYPNRKRDQEEAIDFFLRLYNSPIKYIAIENPVGKMSTAFRKPDQILKPYEYGDPSTKKTCLWLKNLPKLIPTNIIETEYHYSKSGKKWDKWYFQTSLISNLEERRRVRSKTFQGIANAMAQQWSNLNG